MYDNDFGNSDTSNNNDSNSDIYCNNNRDNSDNNYLIYVT